MQVNNLPDLVNAASNGDNYDLINFNTRSLNADDTKAYVSAVGEYSRFVPTRVNQAIDEIARLDPTVQFILAR